LELLETIISKLPKGKLIGLMKLKKKSPLLAKLWLIAQAGNSGGGFFILTNIKKPFVKKLQQHHV
jgi:hypothetical protein|tara:strand:- start:291 stop:485 length:195 start_codon:yes stop_codon:yes gene_type:complete